MAQLIKNMLDNAGDARDEGLPLGQEDPLQKEMATHYSILAWKIPWTEEPGWATAHEVTKSWTRLSN